MDTVEKLSRHLRWEYETSITLYKIMKNRPRLYTGWGTEDFCSVVNRIKTDPGLFLIPSRLQNISSVTELSCYFATRTPFTRRLGTCFYGQNQYHEVLHFLSLAQVSNLSHNLHSTEHNHKLFQNSLWKIQFHSHLYLRNIEIVACVSVWLNRFCFIKHSLRNQ